MPPICSQPVDQPRQRPRPSVGAEPVIGVDVLPQQRELAHAAVGQAARLGLDVGDGARELRAPRIGHDAERAELVATLLHRQKRRHRPRPGALGQAGELVLLGKPRLDDAVAGAGARNQLAQPMIALRPHHQVDRRRASQDLGTLGLGDAARNRDDRALARPRPLRLHLADAPQVGIDLLGRLLADMAGVEDDDVGVLGRIRHGEAVASQQLGHALGVVDVHLATERLDEDLARPGHFCFAGLFAGTP